MFKVFEQQHYFNGKYLFNIACALLCFGVIILFELQICFCCDD
jgi:hypothetical protein